MTRRNPRTAPARTRRIRRGGVAALAVVATVGTVLGVSTTAANASSKPVKVGNTATNLRDCYHPKQAAPGTSCTRVTTLAAGTPVTLVCQYQGENISGDVWWDYVSTPNNGYGYVSDYYLNTGTSSYRVPGVDLCSY